jgi:Transposase DDE domain
MAEPQLSILPKLTEFFSTAHIEASARRTGFVRRTSKITGKVFLALVTLGQWSTPKTSLGQLAAKAAQLADPVAVSPEALHQRMNPRALAFLRELIQTAFAKFHTPDTVCDAALFTPFPQVYIADSTGFSLPASLREALPGTGGSASPAGAKLQLVWEYKSSTFAHFALGPGNRPDSQYVDTVVRLAGKGALMLFDLGYFKLAAFAAIAAAQAYFLSRLHHQATLLEAVAGRVRPVDLARCLQTEHRPLLEKPVFLGTRERVATRLIAVRMPEAVVNKRRRQARRQAKKRGDTPSQAHLSLLAWNLFITNVPSTVWTPQTVCTAYTLRWQVELVFKSWKSHLHLATLTTKTADSTLCYLYGRMLLILLTSALCSPLRARLWEKHRRELSLLKLSRHLQAGAEYWLHALFTSETALQLFLHQIYTSAERLVTKASRKRRTTAQLLRESLRSRNDFFEPALALAA